MSIRVTTALFASLIAIALSSPADAKRHSYKHHHYQHHVKLDASGNIASGIVRSKKTGATAHVGAAYAAKFQALLDAIEDEGATVYDIGGWRPGHCSSGSQHPCNKALDVCQLGYGVVRAKCNLPNRARLNQIARSVGLYSGGEWCHPDTGHFQVDQSAAACGDRGTMIAHHRSTTRTYAARSHQRRHYQVAAAPYYAQPSDYMSRASGGY